MKGAVITIDNAELKAALLSGAPVILTHADGRESEYKSVTAIVYRAKRKRIFVTAEILDLNGRCVVHCDPEKLRLKE